MDPRCNGKVSIGFLFVSAFRNICYLSQKKVSSLRNTSFPYDKENPSVKFMDFLTWINAYWTNIQKKTTKGAYNNENSKFVVFNNWSSWRSSQNSDHSFPKLIFTPQSMRLKNIGVKCCFAHPILFLWKTQVLENTDFLWLIETDF